MLKRLFFLCFLGISVGVGFAQTPGSGSYIIQERPIPTTVTLGGTVIPAKEVTLSAQLPGRVVKLAGEEGDSFKKETILVVLDDRELVAQRRAAWAEMTKAESILRNADMQYWRELASPESPGKAPGGMAIPHLFDQLFTEEMSDLLTRSNTDLDRYATLYTYLTQIEQARSALLSARSQIEAIDAKLRDARSIAPFDGVITQKMVEEGDTVQPGMPLLKFANLENLQIRVEIPARLMTGLYVGMIVPAKLDVGGWGQVRVAQIFPIADPDRHTVTVKFDLPPGIRTGPGQYAQVEIQDVTVQPKLTPIIPTAALVWRGSLPGVYVLSDNKRELRLVRVGTIYGKYATILSGLSANETVEVNPPSDAASGWITQPSASGEQ